MENRELDAIQHERFALPGSMPRDGSSSELVEELIVERIVHSLARLEDQPRPESIQHAFDPAKMVGVGMGDHNDRQLPNALASQKRDHHPPTCICRACTGACIHNYPAATRSPKDSPISLADVEKM